MKTRLRLIADHMSAVAICDGIKYTDDGMVQLKSDKIADYLLEQGWRPPMREITTVEELEALPRKTVVTDCGSDPWTKTEGVLMDMWISDGLEYSSDRLVISWAPFRVVWEPE